MSRELSASRLNVEVGADDEPAMSARSLSSPVSLVSVPPLQPTGADAQQLKRLSSPLAIAQLAPSDDRYDRYWRKSLGIVASSGIVSGKESLVSIHVCDENRKMTRDFCCKRSVLMEHMKYFESFLKEAESGCDDIDISVHCDVDIFEWLMTFIHYPHDPPHMDKTMVVSILISSEFLQIESLVDLCIKYLSRNLTDIVKLPIDLSCISDKLLIRLAQATPSSVLAQTKDRRDKILNKLYKRRVEIDFSRKAPKGGGKALASTMTCCRKCGKIYLDMFVNEIVCSEASPAVDFRGRLARRHSPAADWSLTSYLKLLHSGGMTWEAIYWHVWSACAVMSKDGVFFNAQDTYRYTINAGGLSIMPARTKYDSSVKDSTPSPKTSLGGASVLTPANLFSLNTDDDTYYRIWPIRMDIVTSEALPSNQEAGGIHTGELLNTSTAVNISTSFGYTSNSLFPSLPITRLTPEFLQLLTTQQKHFDAGQNSSLIENSIKTTLSVVPSNLDVGGDRTLWDWADLIYYSKEEAEGRARGRGRRGSSVGPGYARKGHSTDAGPKARAGVDSESPEPNKSSTLRSRSSGAAIIRSSSRSGVGDNNLNIQVDRTDNIDGTNCALDDAEPLFLDSFSVYRALPAHVHAAALRQRGPLHGVWLQQHPIQVSPESFKSTIDKVQTADSLSKIRRDEWFLDVIREYDEKRMECLEDFLVGFRSNVEIQLQSGGKLLDATSLKSKKRDDIPRDYYRDKGRQPRSVKAYSFNV